jgi:hypothetical protein
MADLIPLDYDPFADEETTTEEAGSQPDAQPALAPPQPAPAEQEKPDYVIPVAPELPTVEYAGEPEKKAKPATGLIPLDYDPFAEPEKPITIDNIPDDWLTNVAKGVGERGVELVGGTAGTIGRIVEGAGDWLDQNLGKPVWDADGNISWRRQTPEEAKSSQLWLTQKLLEVEKGMTDPDFGYDPRTTWKDVKNAPFTNIVPFAIEQGLVSIPDMIAAVKNAPVYVVEQAGEIGGERAKNEGRAEPTFGDIIKALPAATISAWMEKFGTEKLLGVGEAALTELKQLPAELLKTLATEGATEAAQQAAQYSGEHAFTQKGMDWWELAEQTLQAGLVGAIFGPAVRTATGGAEIATAPVKDEGEEEPDKIDDIPDVAAPAETEGTPAAVTPEAGESTPGDTAITEPKQPEGAEKQPPQPPVQVPVAPTDPRTEAKPPSPATAPVVAPAAGTTVVQPGQVPPDIGTVLTGTPVAQPAAPVAAPVEEEEEQPGEFDIRETLSETLAPEDIETTVGEHEARLRDMFREELEAEHAQEQRAAATKISTPDEDIAAALRTQPAAVAQPETLGTGQAISPIASQPGPTEEAIVTAPEAAPAAVAAPPPVTPAAMEQAQPATAAVPREAGLEARPPAPDETVSQVAAPREPSPGSLAAFTAAPAPAAPDERALAAAVRGEAAPPSVQPQAAPVTVGEPQAVEPVAVPQPGAKGEKFKRKKKVEVTIPKKAAPATELLRRGEVIAAPSVQPGPEIAPAAAPEARAGPPRTNLSRDAARHARDADRLLKSTVSELPEFHGTAEDVAADVVARLRKDNPGMSPREIIAKAEPEIAAEVESRLSEKKEAADEARIREEEHRNVSARRATERAEKKAERERKLREGKPQELERTGKKKGKSAEGLRHETEEATLRAYAKELKKPPEQRDKLLMEWGQEHHKQTKLKKNPPPEELEEVERKRAEHKARKAEIQEQRAVALEEAEEGRAGLKPERAAVRDQVKTVLAAHPLPKVPENATDVAVNNVMVDHLNAFRQAVRDAKIPLADHIDRTHQSMEENLAIVAKYVSTNPKARLKPHDFMMLQLFAETGADEDFYGLATNEQLMGSGYEEASGDHGTTPERAWSESEDITHVAGKHVEEEGEAATLSPDEQALLRSGRVETREREAARRRREKAGERDVRQITVMRPTDSSNVTVTARTQKGSAVLRDVHRLLKADNPRGFLAMLQNAHVRHLTQLVGDIDVHFVSDADIKKLYGKAGAPQGLYFNYTPAQRVAGQRPQVFINEEVQFFPDDYAHTVLHEMTHAATSLAIRLNLRGTSNIMAGLRRSFHAQLTPELQEEFSHAFLNEAEFVAEAFSNPRFQRLLASINVPPSIRHKIPGLTPGRGPSWWSAFTAAVSNAIGMIRGERGQTYMEKVVSLLPELTYSEAGQRVLAREAVARDKSGGFQPAIPKHPVADVEALLRNFNQLAGAAKSRADNLATPEGRRARDVLSTTGEQIRRSGELFGGEGNVLERLYRWHLKREPLRAKYRKNPAPHINSEKLEVDQARLRRTNRRMYDRLNDVLHEASRYRVDPTVPLSNPVNKHISKKGVRNEQARAMHARLAKEWAALSPEAKKVGLDTIRHFRATADMTSRGIIRNALVNAQNKYGGKLPAGKTIDDAVNWVMSGAAARDPANQTQEDKDYHAALGKTATSLADVPQVRSVQGVYVPFMRKGKYFISVTERPFGTMANPKNLPAGAVMDAENRLLFKDEKQARAFADSHPIQVKLNIMWVDPLTGKKTTSTGSYAHPTKPNVLVTPKKLFVATVQNKRVEMSDNHTQLVNRARELAAQGHHSSDTGITRTHLNDAIRQIVPAEISRLAKNMEQTTLGQTTVGQQAMQDALYDAYIRSLTTPGALARGLRRSGVLGEQRDLVFSTRDYNRDFAHHMANLEMAPQLAAADKAVEDYIRAQQHIEPPGTGLTAIRQAMAAEARNRIRGWNGDAHNGKLSRVADAVKEVLFLFHLFSPHYWVMQAVQPYMTTIPVLNGKYGPGATSRELGRAYALGGGKGFGVGFREMGRQTMGLKPGEAPPSFDNDQWWKYQIRNEPDAAELADVFDEVAGLGFGAQSGIEAPSVSELDKSWFEKGLGRIMNVAKALPESIEGVNRYATATATYRLARRSGKSHESAKREAVLTVEETQGGYGAANNPTFFQNKWLSPFLTFKKYSLSYGQLFYRNLAHAFGGGPQGRKQAIKTVAWLMGTTISLAGVYGLPLVEPLRMLANIASVAFGTPEWDDLENYMQQWLSSMIAWASGSKTLGNALAEANTRGWTRLAGIDTSNTFGADSLLMFGQPKKLEKESVYAWLGKAVFGAPGGMLIDSGSALVNGDIAGAIPWPKLIGNIIKARELATYGNVSKKTGEVYNEPSYGAALSQALGFRPAEAAREFEAGGGATQRRAEGEMRGRRQNLMARWRNAGGSERQRIFREDIQAFNRANPKDRITMGNLIRSKKSAAQRKRERERES